MEGFSVCDFSSEFLINCAIWGSSGKVHSRNFLLEPIWLQNSFSIFLPLIHLSISFKCVLLFNPLIPDSCNEKSNLIKNIKLTQADIISHIHFFKRTTYKWLISRTYDYPLSVTHISITYYDVPQMIYISSGALCTIQS